MSNPKVYVGTYRAYNNGSLRGGWISLKACKDYADFLHKCRALHRGERDPEYMIQDTEDFPDGLDCGEWLSEQDFNDVISACREEAQDDAAPALSMVEQLRQALLARMGGAKKLRNAAHDYKACLDAFIATKDKSDAAYFREHYVGAVKLRGKYYLIEKPRMENRFCFRDEGPDYDFYCSLTSKEERMAAYFKSENLACFDNLIDHIEKGRYGDKRVWLGDYYNDGRIGVTTSQQRLDQEILCTDEERAIILAAAWYGRAMMEKRVDAYLKRYGTSKIHTWIYWADA